MRFGNHVSPDNDAGRTMLTALLCFGLNDESAVEDAPWCAADLPAFKRRTKRIKWHEVGELIGLTFDEWEDSKLWITNPVDTSAADLQAWREERRKESNRKSKQKQRAKEKLEKEWRMAKARKPNDTPRQAAILEILAGRGEGIPGSMSVPELARKAAKHRAFSRSRCQNTTYCDGRVPTPRNMRDAVHETVKQLERKHAVGTWTQPGDRGPVRWVALKNVVVPVTSVTVSVTKRSVGVSDRAVGGKASEIKDLVKNGVCQHALRNRGRGHAFNNTPSPMPEASTSPAEPSERQVINGCPGSNVIPFPKQARKAA
jgi:hypothetical protein